VAVLVVWDPNLPTCKKLAISEDVIRTAPSDILWDKFLRSLCGRLLGLALAACVIQCVDGEWGRIVRQLKVQGIEYTEYKEPGVWEVN
jgi:hypothetical protein